jgi:hypothetical protein
VVAAKLAIALAPYRIGPDADLLPSENGWRTTMSMGASGVVLGCGLMALWPRVPDRCPASHEELLEQVLISILCRSIPAIRL